MSLLKITKVSDQEDLGWGVVLVGKEGSALLRSLKGASKNEAASMAASLKSEGAEAPVSEIEKQKPDQPAWIIEKTANGWAVRFTPVTVTSFDLFLKPESATESPKAAVEAVDSVKKCLMGVEVVWEPPESEPSTGPIHIKIDDEPYEAPENPMTANEILELGGLDPEQHYLVQIKDGERIKYQDEGERQITLFQGATFVGHFTGEKGVSESES